MLKEQGAVEEDVGLGRSSRLGSREYGHTVREKKPLWKAARVEK